MKALPMNRLRISIPIELATHTRLLATSLSHELVTL